MSDRPGSAVARYMRRKAALKIVAKIGMAKILVAIAVSLVACIAFLVLLAAIAGATGSNETEHLTCSVSEREGKPAEGALWPQPRYIPVYAEAAAKYRLGPRGPAILAAIHWTESGFGESDEPGVKSGTNYAGAGGPMGFLIPESWDPFGVDGDSDGDKDVYDNVDSIFAAARLLRHLGAPRDWSGAIFGYNHADWYVRKVENIARSYGSLGCVGGGQQLGPLPADMPERLLYVARWIESLKIPYCWGGGHGTKPGPDGGTYCWTAAGVKDYGNPADGLDCSGAVRWLLVLSGFPDPTGITSGLFSNPYPGEEGLWSSGPGSRFTVWSNSIHVFVEFVGVDDWGTSGSNYAHGPGFGDQDSDGFVASHPTGV